LKKIVGMKFEISIPSGRRVAIKSMRYSPRIDREFMCIVIAGKISFAIVNLKTRDFGTEEDKR
jgi:hypothetical protein